MTSFLKKFKLFVYEILWKIIYPFIGVKCYIRGYYLCNYVLEQDTVYYIEETNRYYRYFGNNLFKEGNKWVDVGFICLEVPGDYKKFTYKMVGMCHFMFIHRI